MVGFKTKVTFLAMAAFLFGGALFVTMYASGNEVIEKYDNMFMVSHTEYRYGESGQIVVRLVDFSGGAVSVNNCTATILYPDKTYFVNGALMNTTGAITGDHYYTFTTPNGPEGVYEYQATCVYAAGAKSKSATNSFHLSSAFNTLFSQVSEINSTMTAFRAEVQSNFSTVLSMLDGLNYSSELAEINSTLYSVSLGVSEINSSLAVFSAETYARLDELNLTTTTIASDLLSINTTLTAQFGNVLAAIEGNQTYLYNALQTNVSQILADIDVIEQELLSINASLSSQITEVNNNVLAINTSIMNEIQAVNLSISSSIADFRQEVQYNFSDVLTKLDNLNASSIDYTVILTQINTTTTNIYDYLTGTMANNINDILTQMGVINATVNRIEQNTLEINTTVSIIDNRTAQILANQEDEVFISTYSG